MRTTITVPDPIVKELLQYSHKKKTTEAINDAIREWLRTKKIEEIKKLQGKLSIDDIIHQLRAAEVKKIEKFDNE